MSEKALCPLGYDFGNLDHGVYYQEEDPGILKECIVYWLEDHVYVVLNFVVDLINVLNFY